ncbi:MAG: ECF transporter S component [Clostridia bacterium]|nr:ECF transporter S component [Clostridia bacterium]MDE7215530.1 ECF transporter S component [Clostridia bacterium]MDE7336636.1 ECF transporter S component [Clostridia bacterium]
MSAKTRKLVFTAVLAALTTAFTLISIPLATGYFNFGDMVIFISSILLGPIYGAIVGAIGGALGDAILGYFAYLPFTLIIKAIEGVIVGFAYKAISKFCKNNKSNMLEIIFNLLSAFLAGIVMALGYFLAEGLLLSEDRWTGGIANLPFNVLQGVISAVVAIILLYPCQLKNVFNRYFYKNAIQRENKVDESQNTQSDYLTKNSVDEQNNSDDNGEDTK